MKIYEQTGTFETMYMRLKHQAAIYWDQGVLWLGRRSDGELLIISCVFILVLLLLIIRMSMRGKDPGGKSRQFGGSVLLVMIFAFGLGWMLDTGAGSLSFVFGA